MQMGSLSLERTRRLGMAFAVVEAAGPTWVDWWRKVEGELPVEMSTCRREGSEKMTEITSSHF